MNFRRKLYQLCIIGGALVCSAPEIHASRQPTAEDILNFNPSPEELAELEKMVEEIRRTDPELYKELERQGQEMLANAGIDPKDFQPQGQAMNPEERPQERPSVRPSPADQMTYDDSKEYPETKKSDIKKIRPLSDIERTIGSLQEALRAIHIKAQTDHDIARVLERFKKEISDLLYYLPVIKHEQIAKHIATQEFTHLYNKLQKASSLFQQIEKKLIPDTSATLEDETNPYMILAIEPGSSQERVEKHTSSVRKQKAPLL